MLRRHVRLGRFSATTAGPTVLVLNSGSSTLKYALFGFGFGMAAEDPQVLHSGSVRLTSHAGVTSQRQARFQHAFEDVCERIGLASMAPPRAVGHRIVHGGLRFRSAALLNGAGTLEQIEAECTDLAPLHTPANVAGVRAAIATLGDVCPQVGVFDTSFHLRTVPHRAHAYALPAWLTDKHPTLRKFGFHGISYESAVARLHPHKNLVIAHLGSGCSVAAIRDGQSVETSMGFTPLEGLMMGTRTGDIDPSVVFYCVRVLGMSLDEVEALLTRQSGLAGMGGLSGDDAGDMRRVVEAAEVHHNEQAERALDLFCYRVAKYIGTYAAVTLGGDVDAIVFTAGVGENQPTVRERVGRYLESGPLGVAVDRDANWACAPVAEGGTRERSETNWIRRIDHAATSKIPVYVLAANEELHIARQAFKLVDHTT